MHTDAPGRRQARRIGAAAALLIALAAASVGLVGSGPHGAGSGAADVVQRTPSGLAVHSSLLGGHHDPPHTVGSLAAAVATGAPVVGAAATPSGQGWWEVAANGGIFTSGDARFLGSAGALALRRPIVGMAATPSGAGYWLVASDGGIFTFGDARFLGSAGALALRRPIVGMAATPDGGGYWLVASDGGIFTFGDARFHGSAGALALRQPIVGVATTPDGGGYWLVASDGGVFGFGDAAFVGAPSGVPGGAAGLVPTSSGAGYWIADRNGQAQSFGDAPAVGSASGMLASPVVAAAAAASGAGRALRLVGTDGSSVVLTPGGAAAISASPMVASRPAGSSSSYTFLTPNNADGSPVRWDPCTPIHYVTNLAEAPAGAAALIAGALAQISAATGMSFVNDGSTTEMPTGTRQPYQPARYGARWAPVVIAWARPSETDVLPGGNVIGEGGSSWVQVGGGPKIYVSGEVVIDSGNTGPLAPTFGSGSTLGELLLHELGHVTGLGHTTDQTQIMYPVLLPMPAAAYGAGDLAGLARLGRAGGCLSTPGP